jgi:hypothetical protein
VTHPGEADHQLAFSFGGASTARPRISPKANKQRSAKVTQRVYLPIVDRWFMPQAGVPKTRADCPDTTQKPCPHVRCRYHLFLEDAEHRAGRPGLAAVPRDERGLTISKTGDLGDAGPGTSLAARWLELERSAKVHLLFDENGRVTDALHYYPLSSRDHTRWVLKNKRIGTLDTLLPFLRVGEPMDVYNDNHEKTCSAELTADGTIKFNGDPRGNVVTLMRVRGVESCALDAIARHGKMSNHDTGECLARHRTLIAREARGAANRGAETAEEKFDMSKEDFMGALVALGQESK